MPSNAISIIIIVGDTNVPRHSNAKSFHTLDASTQKTIIPARKKEDKNNFPNSTRELCCKSAFSHNLQY